MKKILSAIVLFALVVLPMSVMAMTSITDDELSNVTGQAGVSINVDVAAELTIGTVAWGDSNGFSQGVGTIPADYFANAGFVGIEGLTLTVQASGRSDLTTNAVPYLDNDPITIDVGSAGATGAAAVRIGLPTMHIGVSALQTDIFVSGVNGGAPASPTAQVLGSIYMSGVDILLGQPDAADTYNGWDAGYVVLSANRDGTAPNSGINIGFDVKIDSISIGTISYGNTNSILSGSALGAYTSPGYVGVTNFNLDDVNIYGGVAIGVGTLNATSIGSALPAVTQVNIVIANDTTIKIAGALTGTVVLANNQALSGTGVDEIAGELGNFYIGGGTDGLTLKVIDNTSSHSLAAGHSLIQIWAH